jgi:hypothetical protein
MQFTVKLFNLIVECLSLIRRTHSEWLYTIKKYFVGPLSICKVHTGNKCRIAMACLMTTVL